MLDRAELKEIASLDGKDSMYVSLYLNVDPVFNKRGDYDIHFKNMVKRAVESLGKAAYKRVKEDIDRIRDYVASSRRLLRKGLVVISSARNDVWKVYHLNVPVRNEFIVDRTPYTEPLADVLDNYEKYAVLLVEKDEARVFVIHLGEIVEFSSIHTEGVPGKHKQDVWYALSPSGADRHMANAGKGRQGVTGLRTDHYERHIDFHVRMHLEDAIRGLASFVEREKIGRVVIGGPDEAVAAAQALLPRTLGDKVIGTAKAEMLADTNGILGATTPIVEAYERKQEEETVEYLITQALSGGNAALGMADVIAALQERRVMRLVMLKDFRAGGYACSVCGFLSAQKVEPCPSCGGTVEHIGHLADLAGELAVQQGAVIEIVGDGTRLGQYGGIGAILRF